MSTQPMIAPWPVSIWQQFGAAIDMLDNALRDCPDQLWRESLLSGRSEDAEFSEFWYVVYHTLFWLDLYLSGSVEGFAPPAPFTLGELDPAGLLPERPYTRDELRAYLQHGRAKCRRTIEALTDEQARRPCSFAWGEVSFFELLLYTMRHVQEHAAQLNLFLGQKLGSASGWVAHAKTIMTATYIGGPTLLLEFGGVRLLTDPTFDPAGEAYSTPVYTLRKTAGPALDPQALGRIDAVLLSHDHHFDNLDRSGRALLSRAGMVLTTPAAAGWLSAPAIGLAPWQSVDLPAPDGRVLRVTGTPARHGPADGDRGPVTGFVLAFADAPRHAVYVSGDTVWYEGVAEVSRRFAVRAAVLFLGAARVPEVGPAHLTMTAGEAVEAARACAGASILPVHYEGWAHFSESREQIDAAFRAAGLAHRVRWMEPGQPIDIAV